MDLTVDLAPQHKTELRLRNPILTASGTFSNGLEIAKHYDVGQLGALVSKGTTLRPRRGNGTPRTVETPAGMINSIGFQNIGVSALIKTLAPVWERWDVPVIVNIMGETLEEYGVLAARLEGVPGVAGMQHQRSDVLDAERLEFVQHLAEVRLRLQRVLGGLRASLGADVPPPLALIEVLGARPGRVRDAHHEHLRAAPGRQRRSARHRRAGDRGAVVGQDDAFEHASLLEDAVERVRPR